MTFHRTIKTKWCPAPSMHSQAPIIVDAVQGHLLIAQALTLRFLSENHEKRHFAMF